MTSKATRRWALQDAKNRFSEVVNAARTAGPQIVTRRGADAAVVLSLEDFTRLEQPRAKRSIAELLRSAPKVEGGLASERSPDAARNVELE